MLLLSEFKTSIEQNIPKYVADILAFCKYLGWPVITNYNLQITIMGFATSKSYVLEIMHWEILFNNPSRTYRFFFLFDQNQWAWLVCSILSQTKFETAVDPSHDHSVTNCKVALPNVEDFFIRFYASMQCQLGAPGRYVYIYKLGCGSIIQNEVIVLQEARFNRSTGGYDCEYNFIKVHTVRVLSCFVIIRSCMVSSLPLSN